MPKKPWREAGERYDPYLKGTTYRVYRHMLKQRKPVGISEVRNALGLSSTSVSEYHIRKLLRLGLIREEQQGYVIDIVVLENIIRFRRISIPVQTAYVSFFGVTLLLMLFLEPAEINSAFLLAVVVNTTALGVSLYEMTKTLRRI
jgi:hypothetical protein